MPHSHIDPETIESLPATEFSVQDAAACARMAELTLGNVDADVGDLDGTVETALEAARALQNAVERVATKLEALKTEAAA